MIIRNISELAGIVPEGVLRKQGAEMAETGVLKDALTSSSTVSAACRSTWWPIPA